MASTASAMVAKAASQVGYREGKDKNGNWNNVQKFGDWYADAIKNPAFKAVAWCDIFISWCAEFSGNADIIPKSAWVPGRLAYYRKKKATGNFPPRPGDIGIVLRNGSAVHVFLVEKWLGDAVQTLEGNTNTSGSAQGDGVYRLKRRDWKDNPNIIYCRPDYKADPKPAKKAAAKKAAPAKPSKPTIKVSNVRPGKKNEDIGKFNDLLWKWHGPDFKRKWAARWNAESRTELGPDTQRVLQAAYATLARRDPKRFRAVTLPCWPGPELIKEIGGIPE